MARWNRPVSAGTVVLVTAAVGFRAYRHHEERQEVRREIERAFASPAPKVGAPPPPSPAAPPLPAFDAPALLGKLHGVWLYENEIYAFDGDTMTEYDGDATTVWKVSIASPCTLDLHRDGDAKSRAFALDGDAARFDNVDGRHDGDSWLVCRGSRIYVGKGAACRTWRRVEDGSWDTDDRTCSIDSTQPGHAYALLGDEPVTLDDLKGALVPFDATDPAKRFATVDEAKREVADGIAQERTLVGRMHDVDTIVLLYSTRVVGVPVHVDATVDHLDVAAGTVTFAAKAHDLEKVVPLLACTVDRGDLANVRVGERVTVDGAIGTGTDERVELTGCKIARARPPKRH